MRIGIIRKRFNPFGGAEKFIQRLVSALSNQNKFEIVMIAKEWPRNFQGNMFKIQIKTIGINRFLDYLCFIRQVTKALHTTRLDITQSHERIVGVDIFRLGDGVHAAWLARYSKTISPIKRFFLFWDPFHLLILSQEKKIAADTRTHFVVNSEMVKSELQAVCHVSRDRITVIPNGIDTTEFRPANIEERKKARDRFGISEHEMVIGFIGSGFERKGLYKLIDAIETLPDAKLLVAGKDRKFKVLQADIIKRKLTPRIKLLGPVENVRDLYRALDVFALPTLYDPSSNAIIEALSCGVPVLTTEGSGNALDIKNYGAGIVCERDAVSIRNGLSQIFSSDTKLMSENARKLALNHSDSAVLDAWVALYEKIIQKKASAL